MDKLGTKPKKPLNEKGKYTSHTTFFTSPTRRRDFVIHPEWVSENSSGSDDTDSGGHFCRSDAKYATIPFRRSRHADPITWRRW